MAAEDPRCFEKTEAVCRGSKNCTWLSLIDSSGNPTGKGACVSNKVADGEAEGRKRGTFWGVHNEYTDEAKREIDAWKPRSSISEGEAAGLSIAERIRLLKESSRETHTPTSGQIERKEELDRVIEERRERLQNQLDEAKDDDEIREIVAKELSEDGGIMSGIASGLSNLFSVTGSAIVSGAAGAGGAIASGAAYAGGAIASRAADAGGAIASGAAGAGGAIASGASSILDSITKLNKLDMVEAILIILSLKNNPDIKKILQGDGNVIEKLETSLRATQDVVVQRDIRRLIEIFQKNLKNVRGDNKYQAKYLKYKAKYLKLKKELEV